MATESTHLPIPPTTPADAAPHDEHVTHVSHEGTYRLVYALLVVLTGLELLATYTGVLRIPVLLVLGAVKAVLVVAFFMHLRYEKRFLPLVFAGPVIVGVLALLAIQQLVLR